MLSLGLNSGELSVSAQMGIALGMHDLISGSNYTFRAITLFIDEPEQLINRRTEDCFNM